MAGLEKTGVELVAEGADSAIKKVQQFDKAIDQLNKTTGQAERSSSALDKLGGGLGAVSKKAGEFGERMNKVSSEVKGTLERVKNLIPGADKLLSLFSKGEGILSSFGGALSGLVSPAGLAAVAFAGLAASLTAIITLGARGAQLQQLAQAFGNIVGEAGSATSVLDGLRRATRGAVSDFELMRLSTLALQGQQKDFKAELLSVADDGTTALGRVIDATRRIAQNTGQNEALIREKFLYGLRLQSRLRLDDVGVMVDQATAERNYAKALGVSTAALTEQQKKAAFAREALRQLDEIAAGLGERSTALDNFARPLVVIRNILDKLALAALPAFEPIAALMAEIANTVENMANLAFPIIGRLGELVGNLINIALLPLKLAFAAIRIVLEPLLPILYYYIAAITLVIDAVNALLEPLANLSGTFESVGSSASGFSGVLSHVAGGVGQSLSYIGQSFSQWLSPITNIISGIATRMMMSLRMITDGLGMTFANIATMAGQGGGAIIGSFAAGLLKGGTKVIQAVTAIAQIVADFLQGFSPPKVGPLSRIDEGGFNVAKTWAEGFQKGFVRPVETVRSQVTEILGQIGKLAADEVATRLRGLDIAILPFNEQLQLAKARVQEIAGFIDPALKNIDTQRKRALAAFAQGKADAETVRAFDRQIDRLNQIKATGDALTAQAETELAIAEGSQAVERAKLEIQKKRLEMFQQEQSAAEAVAKAVEEKGGAGAAATKAATEAKAAAEKAPKAGAGAAVPAISAGEGITTGAAPDVLANTAIDNAREGILGFFDGLGGIAGDVAGTVGKAGGLFGDGFAEGFTNSGFDTALADFNDKTGDLYTQIDRIAAANPVSAITEKFSGLAGVLSEPLAALSSGVDTAVDSITNKFNSLSETIATSFGIEGGIFAPITALFAEGGLFGIGGLIDAGFASLFGPESVLMTALAADSPLLANVMSFVEAMTTAFSDLQLKIKGSLDKLVSNLWGPLNIIGSAIIATFSSPATSVFEAAKNAISMVFEAIKTTISTFANADLTQILSGLPAKLNETLVGAFVNAVNAIIDTFNNAINGTINGLPGFLRSALGELGIGTVNIGHVAMPGAARGALNLRGLSLVGERGPELVNFKRPATVFPSGLSQQLMNFMASGMAPIVGGGINSSTINNNQRTISPTFNNVSPEMTILLMREMEAL